MEKIIEKETEQLWEVIDPVIKSEVIHKNHRVIRVNDTYLTINQIPGTKLSVGLAFPLEYGKVRRLKSGMAHLIEHIISNKLNDKVMKYNGYVSSNTSLEHLEISCVFREINSKYISKSEKINRNLAMELLVESIKEAFDIECIKSVLETEINIIKNEIEVYEKSEDSKFMFNITNYFTRDGLCVDINSGGRYDKMDELNDPELVLKAMRYLLTTDYRFETRVPSYIDDYDCEVLYERCKADNFVKIDTDEDFSDIFTNEFPMYDETAVREVIENDFKTIYVKIQDQIKPRLVLNIPDIRNTNEMIRLTSLNLIMSSLVLSEPYSMVWKELREKGKTYGLSNGIEVLRPSVTANGGKDYLMLGGILLDNIDVCYDLFKLIDEKAYIKYIDKSFDKCKEDAIECAHIMSELNFTLPALLIIQDSNHPITFKEIVDGLINVTKEDLIEFIETLFQKEKCHLVVGEAVTIKDDELFQNGEIKTVPNKLIEDCDCIMTDED